MIKSLVSCFSPSVSVREFSLISSSISHLQARLPSEYSKSYLWKEGGWKSGGGHDQQELAQKRPSAPCPRPTPPTSAPSKCCVSGSPTVKSTYLSLRLVPRMKGQVWEFEGCGECPINTASYSRWRECNHQLLLSDATSCLSSANLQVRRSLCAWTGVCLVTEFNRKCTRAPGTDVCL